MDYSDPHNRPPSTAPPPPRPEHSQHYAAYYAYQPYNYHHYNPQSYAAQAYYEPAQPSAHAPPPPRHFDAAPQIYYEPAHVYAQAGMTPGASAAAELSQFAETMGAAERAQVLAGNSADVAPVRFQSRDVVAVVSGSSAYSRGGRAPFRGGSGRGNFSQHPPRPDVRTPSRGRGKGRSSRGTARKYNQLADKQLADSVPAVAGVPSSMDQEPVTERMETVVSEPAPELPRRPTLPLGWCDICRVGCNSLEILEQHKNGKRHKRTVQRVQEIETQKKYMVELAESSGDYLVKDKQSKASISNAAKSSTCFESMPSANFFYQVGEDNNVTVMTQNMKYVAVTGQVSDVNREPKIAETVMTVDNKEDDNNTILENPPLIMTEQKLTSEVLTQSNERKIEDLEKAEAAESDVMGTVGTSELGNKKRSKIEGRRLGPKMKFGRGGKRLKSMEHAKSKVAERIRERPRVCTLCNISCDTLAVFDCHLAGKKHASRIKRFQGQSSIYGPVTFVVPPNPPTSYPPNTPEPVYYGLVSREMIQQEVYPMTTIQPGSCGVQEGGQTEWHMEEKGLTSDPLHQEGLENHGSKSIISASQDAANLGTDVHNDNSGCDENIAIQLPVISASQDAANDVHNDNSGCDENIAIQLPVILEDNPESAEPKM